MFPILQKIARDVLAIPISTVASETTFSMSGNKVTKQCNRLKPEIVGTLMCSQSWLWKELQCKFLINISIVISYMCIKISFSKNKLYMFQVKHKENHRIFIIRLYMMMMLSNFLRKQIEPKIENSFV